MTLTARARTWYFVVSLIDLLLDENEIALFWMWHDLPTGNIVRESHSLAHAGGKPSMTLALICAVFRPGRVLLLSHLSHPFPLCFYYFNSHLERQQIC
jgi:hypothetical protein